MELSSAINCKVCLLDDFLLYLDFLSFMSSSLRELATSPNDDHLIRSDFDTFIFKLFKSRKMKVTNELIAALDDCTVTSSLPSIKFANCVLVSFNFYFWPKALEKLKEISSEMEREHQTISCPEVLCSK